MANMSLYNAILKGASETKPSRGYDLVKNSRGEIFACALGAALYAVHGERALSFDLFQRSDALKSAFPVLNDNGNHSAVYWEIVAMNDDDKKSREEIAKWVLRQEEKHNPKTP